MRGALSSEESVLLLMDKTAMDKKSYLRPVPRIDLDRELFLERDWSTKIRSTRRGVLI